MGWGKDWGKPKSADSLEEAASHGWPAGTGSKPLDASKFFGFDTGKDDKTIVTESVMEKGILKIIDMREATEEDKKAINDATLHGTGITQDGKRVPLNEVFVGVDLAKEGNRTAVVLSSNAGTIILEGEEAKEFLNNQIPTHDPYTNPGAFLYYQCECGETLDPKTKRFAELNNCASNAGWKIRWGSQHYVPYCPKCAREKGIE